MRSESIKEIAAALAKAQGQFDHAKKDVKNEFFKSKYADLASVIDAAKKPLSDNGLAVVQIVDTDHDGLVILETTLMHTSGEWISGKYPIRPTKQDPQAVGSAITYARRYAFSAMTGIAADDDDGNAAVQKPTIDYASLLLKSKSEQELKAAWDSIPAEHHDSFKGFKNRRYRELTAPTEAPAEAA